MIFIKKICQKSLTNRDKCAYLTNWDKYGIGDMPDMTDRMVWDRGIWG